MRESSSANDASLTEQVASVPERPGVYLWKDATGDVLYVGKAKALRRRMRQYLSGHDEREQIPVMMERVTGFDYIVTESEVDSLILEKNLIRQFRPPFNVDYRDDKSYPFIAITTGDPYPAVKFTREKHRPGTTYFGPYTDSRAARGTIEAVRKVYPMCSAQCVEWKRLNRNDGTPTGKACFDHHVGKGPGPCVGAISREEYGVNVSNAIAFLRGNHSGLAEELKASMHEAAADLDFEQAARFRNRIEAVQAIEERQKVVSRRPLDVDVIGVVREETVTGVHVFVVREGRVLIGNEFVLDKGLDVSEAELVEGFLLRYYDDVSHIPKEVLLPALPESPEAVESWLSGCRGARVNLHIPKRGEKRELLSLAEMNARHTLMRYKVRTRYDESRLNSALLQLESALALGGPPLRIECYDISTFHGAFSVGSMVVFTNGRVDSSAYRRFRVRMESPNSNDVAMMGEVLCRRFSPERLADGRFGAKPDLVIVDGGKPQLAAARTALESVNVDDVSIVALAKREEEVFVDWQSEPVELPAGAPSLYLIKRVRDEAHRFAVTYHRELRGKAMTASILDEIPGVGPKRKKTLIRAFGSVKRLGEADVDQIAATPGIPRDVALDIVQTLAALRSSSENGDNGIKD